MSAPSLRRRPFVPTSTLAPKEVSGRTARHRWYLTGHLLVGGRQHAVLIWSEHFALALLHCADGGATAGC